MMTKIDYKKASTVGLLPARVYNYPGTVANFPTQGCRT